MRFDTELLHAGQNPDEHNHSISTPIYANSAFSFDSVQHGADLFNLESAGDIYTRISNPTTSVLETRIAALEGGVGAVAFSSGQAATFAAITNIAQAGDEIVASAALYGGTYNLFSTTLKKLGIKVNFVEGESPEDYGKLINDKTRCVFIELLSNPKLNVLDIESIAKVAHDNNLPLVVDNTVPSPYLCNPFKFGADIIIHSTTKFLSGHGNAMGGIVVDSGNFDWKSSGKFPELVEPDLSYHGVSYVETFDKAAYIVKVRTQILRDIGACQSPFNAYMTLLGIETLHLRMKRHSDSALKIAKYLESNPLISWVNYPGLDSSAYCDLAKKYVPKGCSSILTFGVKGGEEACEKFINSLELLIHTTNIGDSRSIITYPALTTHRQLSIEQLKACGISDDLMRLSVGLEDADDIIEDIERALKLSQK